MPDTEQRPPQKGTRVFLTQEEWREFWQKKYTTLYEVAIKILRNDSAAKDAVQNAFESFDRSVSQGRAIELQGRTVEEAVEVFFKGIVRNKARDILRERARHRNLQQRVYEELTHDPPKSPSPEEKLQLESLSDEVQDKLQKVVGQLSPELQNLFFFVLKHLDSDPEELWLLWAKEKGLDPNDRQSRNNFDQLRRRLRQRLCALGIYELLGGKE